MKGEKDNGGTKEEVSVSTFREELPDLLYRVAVLGESFVISKHGKKYALIRPYNEGEERAGAVVGAKRGRRASASSKLP